MPPYTWRLITDAPAGLSLDASGVLSGTPVQPGPFVFTVEASDSAAPPVRARQQVSLLIQVPPLAIVTASLPMAHAGFLYSAQMRATGGQPPYLWMVTGGVLPEGMQLDAQSGQISGVPLNAGASTGPRIGPPPVWTDSRSISISVTDSALPATQIAQTLTIVVQGRGTADPQ